MLELARRTLLELLDRDLLQADHDYSRQELIEILDAGLGAGEDGKGLDGNRLFSGVRQLATRSEAYVVAVTADGHGRGRRYRLHRAATLPEGERRGRIEILHGDNLELLPTLASASVRLIYIDPPFNTGRDQSRTQLATRRVESGGDRTGFQGARFETTALGRRSFADRFEDYIAFIEPRLREAHRLLSPDGSLFVHLDYREAHYAKILLDDIFGRDSFINEIIWAYDYGARSRSKWSAKHDNILWYAKNPDDYVFDFEAMERIPYMAPGLVGPEKAARGKTPTDVWWHTIVSPNGWEKTGYPTQKPLGILRRIVSVHSRPGDQLLDFFAGSGSFGEAGAGLGRKVTLIDANPEAIACMQQRLAPYLAPQEQAPEDN
ncbi:MAG: site-specific DNA-methyltransferase [Myxococcales bacterium]|nr:site-specific DNA-methyltransferase [Myxococcales bacterium]